MKKRDFLKRLLNIVPAVVIGKQLSHQELADKLMKETKETKKRTETVHQFHNASGCFSEWKFYNVSE